MDSDNCRLSGLLGNGAAVGAKLMDKIPERQAKDRLKDWRMNQQQRRFLESLLEKEEQKTRQDVASAPPEKGSHRKAGRG